MMPPTVLAFALFALTFIGSQANAATVEHTFHVRNLTVSRMCKEKVILAVNDQYPGPAIQVTEGDSVLVHVINESPFDMTIHWHGVFQLGSAWADGANMVTQCPIRPGKRLSYRFNVTGQEGTLWWHAHVSYHRVTVHGPLIIRPRGGTKALPFPKPDHEVIIVLGEWWSANVVNVEKEVMRGIFSTISDAFTINGYPGDLYNCSENYKLEVEYGKTYLLRIINAALDNQFFYKVAGHTFTVVGVDATYTKPYKTDVIVIAPGQTVDTIMVADSTPARYYMAAHPYATENPQPPFFENTTTRGILQYKSTSLLRSPMMPPLPPLHDTPIAHRFYTSLTSLLLPGQPTVPLHVDERMFISFGLGSLCKGGEEWCEVNDRLVVASMNNVSFRLPTKMAILEAHFKGIQHVFTTDFPNKPPLFFDFANASLHNGPIEEKLELTAIGTKVKKLKYNATVEIVLQSTAILATQNHPLHIHGFNFFVLAQGFGNYNEQKARNSYNLVDPQVRNTIAVPIGGWAVIRFVANNPGVWLMHCHMDLHLPIGMATTFLVDNGPTPDTTLPPPPIDFPSVLLWM